MIEELNNPEEELNEETEDSTGTTEVAEEEETAEEELFYDIDGEEVSLGTIQEWKSGHMMQADYTKGKQEVSEDRKASAAERDRIDKTLETLSGIESEIEKLISSNDGVDLDDLRETDVSEYLKVKEQRESKQGALSKLKDQFKTLSDAALADNYKALSDNLKWTGDDDKRKADLEAIDGYVKDSNMTPAEFSSVKSAGVMEAILKAAKYEKLLKDNPSKSKKVVSIPKTIKPKSAPKSEAKTLAQRMYKQ